MIGTPTIRIWATKTSPNELKLGGGFNPCEKY